jgi:1-acyl-sn-glycerol-3-phosphate acyltransferase
LTAPLSLDPPRTDRAPVDAGAGLEAVPPLPAISPLLLHWFTGYCRRYIRKHFHAVRVSRSAPPPAAPTLPLVLYANHASWWDPLVGLFLKSAFYPHHQLYAPIDAAMLRRYRMFGRMGFFGVEQGTRRGAVDFLRTSEAILREPGRILAVTPQGRFADVRERPLRFQPGLAHLAGRVHQAMFLPMATEFIFWDDRLPEVLVRFGEPLVLGRASVAPLAVAERSALLEQRLAATQDVLAAEARQRDPAAFRVLLRGGAGQGGIYDLWRSFRARCRGESFTPDHTPE